MNRNTDDSAPINNGAYSDHQEHLAAELRRVSALLTLRVHRHLASSPANVRKLVGAHLDDNDIRTLLRTTAGPGNTDIDPQTKELQDEMVKAREQDEVVHTRRKASRAAGVRLLLDQLYLTGRLTPVEQDVILLLLLAEVDPNAGLLFAYLNDDLTRLLQRLTRVPS